MRCAALLFVELAPRADGLFEVRPLIEPGEETWLTALQAAKILGLSPVRIYAIADSGAIDDVYFGPGKRVFSQRSVNEFKQRRDAKTKSNRSAAEWLRD